MQDKWHEIHTQLKYKNSQELFSYRDILTHNIYGVDLNVAAVGITKLSLWLKTAHHRESLTNLDNNIKFGNSLIIREDAGYYYEDEGRNVVDVEEYNLFNKLYAQDRNISFKTQTFGF